MSKKILVTGAAGFIGAVVAQQLLQQEYQVVGVDNLNDYYDVNLKRHRADCLLNAVGDFEFHELDISDNDAVIQLFNKYQFATVINLAARAGVRYSLENPHVYLSTNAQGNLNLLEQMRQHEVNKYVLASTSSLYAGQPMPFLESLPVNEPISPYAASKKAAESMAFAYHHLFSMDVTVVRYFTVYGPAGRPDMSYFRFISQIDRDVPIQIFGDGTQSRDFTYVDDIARGTIAAATKNVGYEIINLGGGNEPQSLNTMIKMIESNLGKKAEIKFEDFHRADMKCTWADIEKAKSLLNWSPKILLDEGIEKCVKWYMDNKPWSSSIILP